MTEPFTHAAADAWLTKYGQAWEERSPDLASQIFSEDCRYFETPFSAPEIGRSGVFRYWQAVPETQTNVAFRYIVLAVLSQTVIAHWSASFIRLTNQTSVNLDGVFMLEFNDAGLCTTLREWWHRDESPPS